MIYLVQLYCLLWTYVSAYRDGKAERLRSSTKGLPEVVAWLNDMWHASGGWLYFISCLPLLALAAFGHLDWVFPPTYALLYRGLIFNPVRNLHAKEDTWYIGNTSRTDKVMRKWFGANGSWCVSLIFFLSIIISNIIYAKVFQGQF